MRLESPRGLLQTALRSVVPAFFFLGLHLVFFDAAFLESWFGPLYFLWVIGCGFGVLWSVGFGGSRRWIALAVGVASVGVTALARQVSWGTAIFVMPRFPVVGEDFVLATGVVLAAIVLLVVLYWPYAANVPDRVRDSTC